MNAILLSSDALATFGIILMFLAPIAFIIGIILLAVSKKTRKAGIIIMICSVIGFIIGFGTCFANMHIGGLH